MSGPSIKIRGWNRQSQGGIFGSNLPGCFSPTGRRNKKDQKGMCSFASALKDALKPLTFTSSKG